MDEPRTRDRRVLVEEKTARIVAIALEQRRHAGDRQDTGQLHRPPYQGFDGEQCVADEGGHHAEDKHDKRHRGVEHVALGQQLLIVLHHEPLPDGTDEQHWWEDQVDERVRYEDDAEADDQKAHRQHRGIDAQSVLDLSTVEADEQGEQDGGHQPRKLHEQTGGHDKEVLSHGLTQQA